MILTKISKFKFIQFYTLGIIASVFFHVGCTKQVVASQESSQSEVYKAKAVEVKIALIGDTAAGVGFKSVLKLIEAENAQIIMVNGDLGYGASPVKWGSVVSSTIDIKKFSVIGSLGNHDIERGNANDYISVFANFRNANNNLKEKCTGAQTLIMGSDVAAVDEVCTFGNVSVVSSAIGQVFNKKYFASRLENKLKNIPQNNWKLVGYHYTLASLNPGLKGDQSTYRFFDIIRQYGALGAQAHTHSAMATCPIISKFERGKDILCHPDFGSNLEHRFIAPGVGLYVDSSLGGKEARKRRRCHNPTDRDCLHMVDIVTKNKYSRVDGRRYTNFNQLGSMFVIYNVGGDENKALVYYKSIDGQELFRFTITR